MHRQSRRNQRPQDCKRRLEETLREEITIKTKGSGYHKETILTESGGIQETSKISEIGRVGDDIALGKIHDAAGRTQIA